MATDGPPHRRDGCAAKAGGEHDEVAKLRMDNERLRRELDRVVAQAREAGRQQQTFLSLIAHQLKGPMLPLEVSLHAIQKAVERGRALPPDTFPRTLRQTRRIARAIDALLLDLPRVEDGSLPVMMKLFDVREPVRAALADVRLMLESRSFTLTEPETALMVRSDPERIHHIVANLLDNAVKYSPPAAPVEITITSGDGQACVMVRDHGIGIPAAELAHVGTKFYRGSNAPSYLYRGLGVGLYLARSFAELCHGQLSIESREGEGTTSRLALPLS